MKLVRREPSIRLTFIDPTARTYHNLTRVSPFPLLHRPVYTPWYNFGNHVRVAASRTHVDNIPGNSVGKFGRIFRSWIASRLGTRIPSNVSVGWSGGMRRSGGRWWSGGRRQSGGMRWSGSRPNSPERFRFAIHLPAILLSRCVALRHGVRDRACAIADGV